MKKWLAGLLALMVMAFISGCGNKAGPSGDGTFTEQDLAISVKGQVFTAGQPVDGLLTALGGTFEYFEEENDAYDGLDKIYEYETLLINTVPFEGKDLISMLYVYGGSVTTSKNIGIGSSRKDVETAYGGGYTYDEGQLTYWAGTPEDINTPCLYFDLDAEEKVVEFGIMSMPLEDAETGA